MLGYELTRQVDRLDWVLSQVYKKNLRTSDDGIGQDVTMCLDEVIEWERSIGGSVKDREWTLPFEEAGCGPGHPPICLCVGYSICCMRVMSHMAIIIGLLYHDCCQIARDV